jgi:hypothetical protein
MCPSPVDLLLEAQLNRLPKLQNSPFEVSLSIERSHRGSKMVRIKQLTQNSAAAAFGKGSFPSKTFMVNKNRNSPASGGCS